MSEVQQQDLVAWVTDWVRANNLEPAAVPALLKDDTDLLSTGLLDSVGFVELLAALENRIGCAIDLSDVDPAEFTTVRGLCGLAIARNA
jgi:acyl carrier protein